MEFIGQDKQFKCVLCKRECIGYGNNPEPLSKMGQCCDDCNSKKVILARLKLLIKTNWEVYEELDTMFYNALPKKAHDCDIGIHEAQCDKFGKDWDEFHEVLNKNFLLGGEK